MKVKKLVKKSNRLMSILISVLICLTVIPNVNINADEEKDKIFNYLGYSVEYNIVNEWEGNQNIEIKFTNTGSEPIYNWALKYNACGEISGLWNATAYSQNGTNYIIKNAGYNYEILPEASVTFGYTLTGSNLTAPSSFENCTERVEIKDKYNAELVITDKWENGFTGYIDIQNISDIPLEAWKLSFDTNFKVDNFWNANIVENSEYSYTASSKIMSNPIQPNTSVQVGISTSFESGVEPILSNVIMSAVQIKNDLADSGDNDGNIIDDSDENVGRIFFKDLSSKDDLIYDSEGNCYVKNQILFTAREGVSYGAAEDFSESLNAEIVGYIELTNDYQIEFNYDMSVEELFDKIEDISQSSIVEYTSPNIVFETECDNFPNDTQIQPQHAPKIDDRNWSLYAINAPDAWEKYEKSNLIYPVKIGVIDNMFYKKNDDLDFVKVWNNPKEQDNAHGTLVAGVIGAKFNNNLGTAGICPKAQLYGFADSGTEINEINWSGELNCIIKIKYALALMIGNGIKVINVSTSYKDEDNLETGTEIVDKFLRKLLDLGYDFVIVNSAGNHGDEPDPERYDAQKNSYFANIPSDSPAYSRIIVVGAVVHQSDYEYDPVTHAPTTPNPVAKKDKDGNYTLECEFRNDSNYGERVEIVAPGGGVASTSFNILSDEKNYYTYFGQTSAAAPQVAGVAGLIYSIKPDLKGSEVKSIIINSAKDSAEDDPKRNIVCDKGSGKKYEYPLLDAKAAVDFAIAFNGPFQPDLEKDEAIVYGTVTDENDNIVPNAKIKITSSDGKKYEETADEKGLYTFTLPFGTYDIKFYTGEEPALKNLFFGKDYQYHLVKDKKIGKDFWDGTVIAYPLDVKLDNIKTKSIGIFDSNGQDLSQINVSVKKNGSSEEYSAVINSKGFVYGEPEDGSYTIVISKAGYTSRTITAIAKDGKLYAKNGELLEKILLESVPTDAPAYLSDLDYALYSALSEPEANEMYALVRIAVSGEQLNIFNCYTPGRDEGYDEELSFGTIDYGDGTSAEIELFDTKYMYHTYAEAGDYIVKITYTPVEGIKNSFNFYRREGKFYPIGVKIGSDVIYDDVCNYIYPSETSIGAIQNVKYVKFNSDYWCSDKFSFTYAYYLQRIEYTASKKFTSLNGYSSYGKFSCCYALDFSNLIDLFSEITEVPSYAFNSCYCLTDISLPKCTKIDGMAFSECYSLKSINIPNCTEISVNTSFYYAIGAFYQCRSLVMINLPVCESIGEDAFYGCNSLQKVYAPQCREVGSYAFGYCSALTDVKLSDSCIYGDDAFIGCTRLVPSSART